MPARGWHKQMIDARGVYAGCEAKTVPGVREAVEQKHRYESNAQMERVARVCDGERL
jgi:N-acetylated-alpha-linked acidic dipeptidase